MKLKDLDLLPGGATPLRACIRWARGLLEQLQHRDYCQAAQDIDAAEKLLEKELNPNVSREVVETAATSLDRSKTALRRSMEYHKHQPGRGIMLSADEVSALALYESVLIDKVEAMREVLSKINRRVVFIGWPAETFWNAGTAEHPHWVEDWREELAMIESILHTRPYRAPNPRETKPWNMIPEEHRPGHENEGRRRLHELHLAWLSFKEHGEDPERAPRAAYQRLEQALARVFDRQPVTGGSLTLTHKGEGPCEAS